MSTAGYAAVSVIALILALGVLASFPEADAQFIRINMFLDKVAYAASDESVEITGCLFSDTSVLGTQVRIDIYDRDGELLLTETATVNETCNFSASIDTRMFSEYGDYLAVATYQTASDKKAFRFTTDTDEVDCAQNDCEYLLELKGAIYQVKYRMTAGTMDKMLVDLPARSLMILVNSTESNGTLTLTLPRSFIDARQNETDTDYRIFIGSLTDGIRPVDHLEIANDAFTRTISVVYPTSKEIVLISVNGTYVAPEFGGVLFVVGIMAGLITLSFRFFSTQKNPSWHR